jgi:hypothetical protein
MLKYWFLVLLFFFTFISNAQDFFIENEGQIVNQYQEFNSEVRYVLSCDGYNVRFFEDHFAYELISSVTNDSLAYEVNRIEIWFNKQKNASQIIAHNEQKETLNYYKNNHTFLNVKSYENIVYKDVWNGVDIEFFKKGGVLKYNYIISKTAKANFSINIRGAQPILNEKNIHYEYDKGILIENIPSIFEIIDEQKEEYTELEMSIIESNVHFSLPRERKNTIIIDPIAYGEKYSTYYGGNNIDFIYSIDNGVDENVVIGGYTLSANNIVTTGAYQTSIADFDVFIAKFDSLGNRTWGTYYGGANFDRCYALIIDNNDNIIVTGNSTSPSGIATAGAYQTSVNGSDDGFIAKFNALGQLIWATYYGGNAHDFIADVAVSISDNIFITGHTSSTNLAVSASAHNTILNGTTSAFLAAFNSNGDLLHSTYYGYGTSDEGQGIKCGSDGNIYMSGFTSSTTEIAYGLSYQPTYQGGIDAFLVKFSTTYQPIWGTYVGASDQDQSFDLALDDSLNVYIIGQTSSTSQIANANSYQQTLNSNEDGFIMKFDSSGTKVWGTYFGGEASEYLSAIELNESGLWISGNTTSTTGISNSTAINDVNNGEYDNMVVNFSKSGNKNWATYLGSNLSDYAQDITLIDSTSIVICGFTDSQVNFTTANAHQTFFGGGLYDGFWTKLCQPLNLTLTSLIGDFTLCEGDSLLINSLNNFDSYLWSNGDTISSTVLKTTGKYWLTTLDQNQCPGRSDTITLTVIPKNDITITGISDTICVGDSVLLSVPNSYVSYTWSNADTNYQQDVLDSGNYWLTALDSLGCTHFSDTFNLTFSQSLYTITVIGSTVLCQGGSVILSITSGLSGIQWSNGVTSPSQLVDSSGVFWFTAINAQGCTVNSDTIQVTLVSYQNPVAALDTSGYFNLCNGDTLLLAADTGFVGYNWSDGSINSYLNIFSGGQYYVIATDSNGCTAFSDTAIVNLVGTGPYFVFSQDSNWYCKSDSVFVEADSSLTNVLWSDGSTQNSFYTNLVGNIYFSALDSIGCSISSDTLFLSHYLETIPIINVLNVDSVLCVNEPVYFDVQPQIYLNYLWWLTGDTISTTQVSFSVSGTYGVNITVIDSNGCSVLGSDSVFIALCLSIKEQNSVNVSVYPNPTKNSIRIISKELVREAFLYDNLGKKIAYWEINAKQHMIDLSNFPNQNYLLRLVTKRGEIINKKITLID